MIVKNAYKPPVILSLYSSLTFFIFPIFSLLIGWYFNAILGLVSGFVGLILFVISIKKDHVRQDVKLKDYTIQLSRNFHCPECNRHLDEHIEHGKIVGLPILYHCEDCEIIWFTGLYYDNI